MNRFVLAMAFALAVAPLSWGQRPTVGPSLTISPAPTVVPLTIRGASAQTSDLQQFVDSTNRTIAGVTAGGAFYGSFVGAMTPSSASSNQVVYTDAHGSLTTSSGLSYNGTLFAIAGQTAANGLFQANTGIEFEPSSLGPSTAGNARLRYNGSSGRLEVSSNGSAYATIDAGLFGSGVANDIAYWTSSTALGDLGAAADGQIPIGVTGGHPVFANVLGNSGEITVISAPGVVKITMAKPVLSATSGAISGTILAGVCDSATVTVTGAATSMVATVSPNTYPGDAVYWKAQVTSANTVTVYVCGAIAVTPTSSTYNVRVIQ